MSAISKDSNQVLPFGKYKGRPVEMLVADEQYRNWLMAQPWFAEKFRDVYNIVVNYGSPSEDTPEHNALQARFLDDDFCMAITRLIDDKPWDQTSCIEHGKWKAKTEIKYLETDISVHLRTKEAERAEAVKRRDELQLAIETSNELQEKISQTFEHYGWDVMFKIEYTFHNLPCGERRYCIECKPTIGDDYPSVLRQIKGYSTHGQPALLVGTFSARGATLEQVRKIFGSSGIKLVMLDEVLTKTEA